MATFVLIHGAWGGGWGWRAVATGLRAAGHEAFTPTLTGLGERAHLARPETDLTTHIQDVVGVLEYEDLHDVILVGHSYGGMAITGAADRVPERLAQLIYLDAYAPRDGQSMLDVVPPARRALLMEQAQTVGEGWMLPALGPGTDPRSQVPQPFRTYEEPVHLSNAAALVLPRTYIRCTIDAITGRSDGPAIEAFFPHAQRAQAEGWRYFELEADHSCYSKVPEMVTELLLRLV
jgi:pimeloyl-ACP methyl ester carboxylesterase